MTKVAVVGSSGFIGRSVCGALENQGVDVVRFSAPRFPPIREEEVSSLLRASRSTINEIVSRLEGVDAVVNAAGNPDASSGDFGRLLAANGAVPAALAEACKIVGITRFIQVSSAAVQGHRKILDATQNYDAFSAYARSKTVGERVVLHNGPAESVIYRPPSVHDASRRVTRLVTRIALSPASSVAQPGSQPAPHALLDNVSDAIAFLATSRPVPERIVIHPWEGITVADLLLLLGGREPIRVPRLLARTICRTGETASRVAPRLRADTRRLEMIWFGQLQDDSWLTTHGWQPAAGRSAWAQLGVEMRSQLSSS